MKIFLTIFVLASIGLATDVGGCTIPPGQFINNSALKNSGIMEEIWKDVTGYKGLYKVSNLGRVKSSNQLLWNGSGYFTKKGRILKQCFTGADYLMVGLHDNGRVKCVGVHVLVAKEFIPNPLNKRTVNHKDCNKENNFIDNLEWNTHKENSIHAVKNGLIDNYKPVQQFDKNNEFVKDYKSITDAFRQTGVPKGEISIVCSGKRNTARGFIWKFKD